MQCKFPTIQVTKYLNLKYPLLQDTIKNSVKKAVLHNDHTVSAFLFQKQPGFVRIQYFKDNDKRKLKSLLG